MKTVFLTNNSCSAKFIANSLNQKRLLDAIIIEEKSGKIITKILREVKLTSWKKIPEKFLDLCSIWIYSILANHYIKKHLLKPMKNLLNPIKTGILGTVSPEILFFPGGSWEFLGNPKNS